MPSKRPDRQSTPLLRRFRGCGARLLPRPGSMREVSATMAQWTAYGPGRLLKPAWAFEVATRFGEHFVNRERFEKVSGRLTVSVTEQSPLANHLISDFSSESALGEALVASCFIPYPGQWHINCGSFRAMDGGFTNNQPALDSRHRCHLLVRSSCNIRPTFKVHPMQALRVPTESECWWLFNQGFIDARSWLVKPSTLSGVRRFSRFSYPQSSKNRCLSCHRGARANGPNTDPIHAVAGHMLESIVFPT